MSQITGKWEYQLPPERRAEAESWIAEMEAQFTADGVGKIIEFPGSAADNGFMLDASVGGLFKPQTATIYLFYREENNLAYRAEELAHYLQYRDQGLIGKSEQEIGAEAIGRNEDDVVVLLERHGFVRIR